MDHVNEIVDSRDSKLDRQLELFDEIKWLVPEEYKHLVGELEDLVLNIRIERIERTFAYALNNSEELKRTVIGF